MFFFFNDTATTEIYTLSLHDALPIYRMAWSAIIRLGLEKKQDLGVMVRSDIGHAHDSAVPSGLRQLRNRIPNLKRLSHCQFLPSGEENAAHSGRIMLVADRIP